MKTTARQFSTFDNLALVQFEFKPESTFQFKPGEPEIKKGGLVISETGAVGIILAENNTNSYLLLTDGDVLIGAKQNRVVNKSVLLPPFSKIKLSVSCIERGRWSYTTKNFDSSPGVADNDLRREKASSIAFCLSSSSALEQDVQSKVWSHISRKLSSEKFFSDTESYYDLISFKSKSENTIFPEWQPESGCNGLAFIMNNKVEHIEIFGTEEVYKFYFLKLINSAFLQIQAVAGKTSIDKHEAFFKVVDLLDNYETEKGIQDFEHEGTGSFHIVENNKYLGFNLKVDEQLLHNVIFTR